MKRLLLAAVFLAGASSARALKPLQTQADRDEYAAISAAMQKERMDFPLKINALRKPMFDASIKIDNEMQQAALQKVFDDIVAAHKAVMTDVVQRTVKLFDIQPSPADQPWKGGSIVTGPLSGTHPTWAPVYAPETTTKTVRLNGKDIPLTADPGYVGITWADGTVEFPDRAFIHSPGYLAAIIYHESVHFAQWTTKGRGDTISALRSEVEAPSADCSPAAAAIFNLTQDERSDMEASFTGVIEKFRRNPGGNMMSSQFVAADTSAGNSDGFWESAQSAAALEREARSREAAGEVVQNADRDEQARRDQKQREDEFNAQQRAYDYILSALGLACSDPREFHAEIDHGQSATVEVDSDRLRSFFNADMGRDRLKSWGPRPNSCQAALVERLIAAPGRVTTTNVLQWAFAYREAHPSQLRKFTASIADFVGSIGNLFSDGGDVDYSGGGNRSGTFRPSNDGGAGERFRQSIAAQTQELGKYDGIIRRVYFGDGQTFDGRKGSEVLPH